MAWAAASVVLVMIALAAGFWWLSRRPRVTARFNRQPHRDIDWWLLTQYGLDRKQRSRVQRAFVRRAAVTDPSLQPALHGAAPRVLSGEFRSIGVIAGMDWISLGIAVSYAGLGVVSLSSGRFFFGAFWLVLSAAWAGLFAFQRFVLPGRARRNAQRLLGAATDQSTCTSKSPDGPGSP